MPSLPSQPHSLRQPAQRSDENWAFTAVAVFLVGLVVVATGGYQYLQYSKQQDQAREERQTYQRYNDYLKSNQEPAAASTDADTEAATNTNPAKAASPAEAPATAAAQPTMAQKLLSHPAVTPGPGFDAPGVQQTGVTIIDAMDQAQANARSH